MTGWKRVRSLFSLMMIILVSLPLASLAQDPPKDDEKKDEAKEKKEEGLPLKTDKKIEFTTDEGTWMSLDVSSDGTSMVFDLLGDVYTVPTAGGEAKRIIGGLSFESQPKFSPDGKKIAFISDRSGAENLWLADADGSHPKALTRGRNQMFLSPSWTPDGQYVIASKSTDAIGTFALFMYHKDGGSGVSIGQPEPHTAAARVGAASAGAAKQIRRGRFG